MDEPLLTWAAAKKRMRRYRNAKRDCLITSLAFGLLLTVTADGLLFPSFPNEGIVLGSFFLIALTGIAYVYIGCWFSSRQPGFFCCHCKPRLFLNRTGYWKCPYCLVTDFREDDYYSFLAPCRNCKKVPSGLRCPHCGNAFFLKQGEDEMLWAEIPGGKPKPPEPLPPQIPKKQPTILERIEANLELEMRKELLMQMGPMEKIEALKKEFPHYPNEVWEKLAEKYAKPDDLRYPIEPDLE
jgi:hypothetical protein